MKNSFQDPLLYFISYLRLQTNWIAKIKTKWPTVASTLCLSIGNVFKCILQHHASWKEYIDDKAPTNAPGATWCILVHEFNIILSIVKIWLKSIQGKERLVGKQNGLLNMCCVVLFSVVAATDRSLTGIDEILEATS